MIFTSRDAAAIWVLAGMLAAPAAWADYECVKGFRDTTAAERQSMTRALEVVKKSLPPVPKGWAIAGDDQFSVTQSICRDFEAGPWDASFDRVYRRTDDQAARDAKFVAASEAMKADFEGKQPRLDALMAKIQKLSNEMGVAGQKGDYARIEALGKEVEKLQAEYEKVASEGDPEGQLNAAAKKINRDTIMSVTVRINPRSEQPGDESKSLPAPKGAQSAFRWRVTQADIDEDHALVLVGPWKPSTEGNLQPAYRAGVSPAAPQAIAVALRADQSRLMPALGSIDFSALAASLTK
jgi:hypothetical protein